jgi:hypothetical protein
LKSFANGEQERSGEDLSLSGVHFPNQSDYEMELIEHSVFKYLGGDCEFGVGTVKVFRKPTI